MKYSLSILLLAVFFGCVVMNTPDQPQISNSEVDKYVPAAIIIDSLDTDELLKRHSQQSGRPTSRVYVHAKTMEVDIDVKKEANLYLIPGGWNLYALSIKSVGAVHLEIYYKDFFLTESAHFLVYTPGRKPFGNKYNYHSNFKPHPSVFVTRVDGDEIILELLEQTNDPASMKIAIIAHGFR